MNVEEKLPELIESARTAMARAHVPVSGFSVGAAVLTKSGRVYAGCNTESIIAGLGICAERSAVDHAVIHGDKDLLAVAVISRRMKPLFPCGVCRQYLYEFAQMAGTDPIVHVVGRGGESATRRLSEIMPHGFGPLDKARADEELR